ncbi:asparagine synthase (glutamine-hydrolyzing) [Thalassospira alkalitolerans]|uniref:asparagine synthase (glutamine-hydrolyzing) n=1 Tax=Thalassospira alkalitolerans TaxID=1293890 RepID=UPI003AA7F1AB
MCGILGFWLKRPLNDGDIAQGEAALQLLAHRGPDGFSTFVDQENGLFLGHRRLAILDLDVRSAQPMHRYGASMVFNGEIYNFLELRKELEERGARFTTTGDSEVLMAAWREYGQEMFQKLDGMYAVCIRDGDAIILATDPFGEKPLYVYEAEEGFYFASEPRPLIEIGKLAFNPTVEEENLFLALGFLPPPMTGYKNMSVAPPGFFRRYSKPDSYKSSSHAFTPYSKGQGERQPNNAFIDEVSSILATSISRRLRSDVPVGLFLSAGVDSALLAAMLATELHQDITAYTVTFPDGRDEAGPASEIAAHLGMKHRVIDSRETVRADFLPRTLADIYAVPNDNLTAVSVEQMSQAARNEVTVALSGLGGDELAYGYNKYDFMIQNSAFYKVPPSIYELLARATPNSDLFRRVTNLVRFMRCSPSWRIIAIKNGIAADAFQDTRKSLDLSKWLDDSALTAAAGMRSFDICQTMPANYIPAVDRGSMRAGLEVRCPFLSLELFRKMDELSIQAFEVAGRKKVLKRLLNRYLPSELVERPKQGFVFPVHRWSNTLGQVMPDRFGRFPGLTKIWQQRDQSEVSMLFWRAELLYQLKRT